MKQDNNKSISGFYKLSKDDKIQWILDHFYSSSEEVGTELKSFWLENKDLQKTIDGFSENTVSNFIFPFGVAPNFIINSKTYCVPMVIEESSVVAAASSAAKFWSDKGGFKAEIKGTVKIGQVHFTWNGDFEKLSNAFPSIKKQLIEDTNHITANMRKRGGGISNIDLIDMSHLEEDYYQLKVSFETCDSMGANFINSVLEEFGRSLKHYLENSDEFIGKEKELSIIMAILSNFTPDCLVSVSVECPIDELGTFPDGMDAQTFAYKFHKAVRIAEIDPYRAATHNKGIFNGIDAVVLATANDFRAIEANGHTYASKDGQYKSLSTCSIENGIFKFWMDIPLTLGTVGGLTKLHPLAKRSLEMLGNPTARELMCIIASVGLAQNFAALKSLTTTGIQKGHMKMHLMNVLNHLKASEEEIKAAEIHFECNHISFSSVREYLEIKRKEKAIHS